MKGMPVNKTEHLIFTTLMVFVMAGGMTLFNSMLHNGYSLASVKGAWLVFPFTFTVAFLVEWFFVGKMAMKLSHKFLKEEDPLPKKIVITALCFVTQMVIIMSLLGPIVAEGFSENILEIWMHNIPRNFIMAFLLQIILAGPLVGFVFRKLFPLGTIVLPSESN